MNYGCFMRIVVVDVEFLCFWGYKKFGFFDKDSGFCGFMLK